MDSALIEIRTGDRPAVVDITADVAEFCRGRGGGLVNVFVPHATCGVAIIETGAGSDDDLLLALEHLLPRDDRWRHRHGAPGHGADHVMPALVAPSVSIPVIDGEMMLGTWQSVTLVDPNVDNPVRRVRFSFLSA
jgi:secondary thiamine-phosphate synthase enzyme